MQRHLICIRQLPGSLEKCSTSEWKEGPRMLYHFKTGFNMLLSAFLALDEN